jgi:hypothetical protein
MFFTESGLALVAAVIFAALAKILLHGRSTSITDGIVLK